MFDTVRELIENQLEAAFCTLNSCINLCPEESWNEPVVNLKFCQVAFHTLFFADLYLEKSDDLETLRQQPFHQQAAFFFSGLRRVPAPQTDSFIRSRDDRQVPVFLSAESP